MMNISFIKFVCPSALNRSTPFYLRAIEKDLSGMLFIPPKYITRFTRMHTTKISGTPNPTDLAVKSIYESSGLVENQKKLGSSKEVRPPWIAYPGSLPSDSFWKFGGEAYMQDAFLPYMQTLNENEKDEYLKRWEVTDDWAFFFDPELKEFLDKLDTE